MTAQPAGEENYGPLLRHSRSRRSRPSARSAILRGSMRARPDRAHITENYGDPRHASLGYEGDGFVMPAFHPSTRPGPGLRLIGQARLSPLRSACRRSERQSGCFYRRAVSGTARRTRASLPIASRLAMTWKDRQVPDPDLLTGCRADLQTRAMLPSAGSGGAMPVKRTNAVMPTAIAPMTEKKSCQTAEGIIIWARPCVAL